MDTEAREPRHTPMLALGSGQVLPPVPMDASGRTADRVVGTWLWCRWQFNATGRVMAADACQ